MVLVIFGQYKDLKVCLIVFRNTEHKKELKDAHISSYKIDFVLRSPKCPNLLDPVIEIALTYQFSNKNVQKLNQLRYFYSFKLSLFSKAHFDFKFSRKNKRKVFR